MVRPDWDARQKMCWKSCSVWQVDSRCIGLGWRRFELQLVLAGLKDMFGRNRLHGIVGCPPSFTARLILLEIGLYHLVLVAVRS